MAGIVLQSKSLTFWWGNAKKIIKERERERGRSKARPNIPFKGICTMIRRPPTSFLFLKFLLPPNSTKLKNKLLSHGALGHIPDPNYSHLEESYFTLINSFTFH
jgi:hypothetical protein